jgi:drug/metabolite transporter (DMT)-like permease
MSATGPTHEPLAPAPSGSRWGRNAAMVYLGVVAVAFAFTLRELATERSGTGTWAISVLTAPWSVLLAGVARVLAGRLEPGAMRVLGLALVLLSAALNARILYGIGARAERDARDSHR